ncbi:MAG: hypothetical protein MUO37_14610 [Methyloceanibacter sp.]|nr:hypothetical protein [Methyloceanibacter sp.]
MLRTLPGPGLRLLAVLLPLWLGACADTLTSNEVSSSSALLKDYDKTLTKSEQKAAITELEEAKAKAKGEAPPDATGSTAATGAKSAETQD